MLVSPMVLIEFQYLFESGKLNNSARAARTYLEVQLDVQVCDLPFAKVAMAAASLAWTRDLFDRLIVGQAAAAEARLLTVDERILANYPLAVW
ncbi:MAG: hypothetical protein SFV18_02535 [Bryobacteraceae bacterium]|nr:hypothetical protein [Bryobacteraceae bacterium]